MNLKYLTAGESHGPCLTVILEGIPAGLSLSAKDINKELKRRQQGYGRGGRMKIESDKVRITAGLRHGKTLGSPLSLIIENKDHKAWKKEMNPEAVAHFKSKKFVSRPRPGHADLTGGLKYNHKDLRNVLERASARETAARVAVGAVCRVLLQNFGITCSGYVTNIGGAFAREAGKLSGAMKANIDAARDNGDSLGGEVEIIFSHVPQGLGSYVHYDRKLDAKMAQTLLSIQAVKGVEFGLGFDAANLPGSVVHDAISYDKKKKSFSRQTNHAGGFEGGMTTGEEIIVRAVMKPISTLYKPLDSVDIKTKKAFKASVERSDTCAVEALAVIAENILCFDLAKALIEKCGGDSVEEMQRNYKGYLKQLKAY
jgi:chorismate synthase